MNKVKVGEITHYYDKIQVGVLQVTEAEVKVGDKILYGKYSGNEITTKEGEELLIMREEDILAIIK